MPDSAPARTGPDRPRHLDSVDAETYARLREIAGHLLKGERPGHTLSATALANEAWVKLGAGGHNTFNDRRHLLMTAARAMRQVLVDAARRKAVATEATAQVRLGLAETAGRILTGSDPHLTLDLDEALTTLNEQRSDLVDLIVFKVFGGMTNAEIAGCLECSVSLVEKEWSAARAFLLAYVNRRLL